MANPQLALYNFYGRYLWAASDFQAQQDGIIGAARGVLEGLVAASVLSGFDVAPSGATLACTVASGIAASPSGYLDVTTSTQLASFSAADATNPRRDLIVARPSPTPSTFIANPTIPLSTVPLLSLQECVIAVISGTAAATPQYPAALSGDTILAGVRIAPSATSLAQSDIDFEVRDIPGKNTRLQQNMGKFDNRLRPYRYDQRTLGIKPSQLFGPSKPNAFTFVIPGQASAFPRASGAFATGDTFLNFQTGAVSGADTTSSAFTPTIPTAGNCIVATVVLDSADLLHVYYGTLGTRAQCAAGIANQQNTGSAGNVSATTVSSNNFPIAFVLLSSKDGANITECDVFDARSIFAFPSVPNQVTKIDGTGILPTSATSAKNLCSPASITIGPGDFQITASLQFHSTTTASGAILSVSTTTGALSGGTNGVPDANGQIQVKQDNGSGSSSTDCYVQVVYNITLAVAKTLFLVGQVTGTGGTCVGANLQARRFAV